MAPKEVRLHSAGRKNIIEINEDEEITMQCHVEDAKPVAAITWLENGRKLKLGKCFGIEIKVFFLGGEGIL